MPQFVLLLIKVGEIKCNAFRTINVRKSVTRPFNILKILARKMFINLAINHFYTKVPIFPNFYDEIVKARSHTAIFSGCHCVFGGKFVAIFKICSHGAFFAQCDGDLIFICFAPDTVLKSHLLLFCHATLF